MQGDTQTARFLRIGFSTKLKATVLENKHADNVFCLSRRGVIEAKPEHSAFALATT
jgi:hypothetical protein